MPYIKQEIREEVDNSISDIVDFVRQWKIEHPSSSQDGILNYIITRIVVESMLPLNYSSGSDMIKTFECAKLEVYRRLIAPYECEKADQNGDLIIFNDKK